jgi:hypothetical protein
MKKVKLLLEQLHVESFAVHPDSPGSGTVLGLDWEEGSGVHSECLTHCATDGCEACNSVVATHCKAECPSWDGGCVTTGGGDLASCPGGTEVA